MMKKMLRYSLPLLLAVTMLLAAVGCNLGNSNENSVIQIKDILFTEDQVTVIYEDGYEIKWDQATLMKNALTYTVASFYTGTFSPAENGTGGDADKVVTQTSTENASDMQIKTVTVGDAAKLEPFSDGKVIYGGSSTATMTAGGMGVRVMGTTGGDGHFSYVVTNPEGGSSQVVGNQMVTITNAYMEIDGKKYAVYDADPRFAEYFSTRLTEATVLKTLRTSSSSWAPALRLLRRPSTT